MTYLIVNGDDFGASRGINRAMLELHEMGVLTSASLMISAPAADHAVKVARSLPSLGVGLHLVLTDEDCTPLVDFDDAAACFAALQLQIELFVGKLDRPPTHLDSHQNVHRDPRVKEAFLALATRFDLPLREHSVVRYFPDFYGQWDDGPHHEHISIDNLLAMLDARLEDGVTELSCHPGYMDRAFDSPYNVEREIELQTLSNPRLLGYLAARGVTLIRFSDLPRATAA